MKRHKIKLYRVYTWFVTLYDAPLIMSEEASMNKLQKLFPLEAVKTLNRKGVGCTAQSLLTNPYLIIS